MSAYSECPGWIFAWQGKMLENNGLFLLLPLTVREKSWQVGKDTQLENAGEVGKVCSPVFFCELERSLSASEHWSNNCGH